jgi:SAM-dependent methyltransferase
MLRGLSVVAIDADAKAVALAKARGVDARVCDWVRFEGSAVDAIVFERSLHHISPLADAVERIARLLSPGGVVIVEDFAFDEADDATALWLARELRALKDGGAVDEHVQRFTAELMASASPGKTWHTHHGQDHHVHSATALATELEKRFEISFRGTAAYLFRYVCACLKDGAESAQASRKVLAAEQAAIAAGEILAIGRRFVGKVRA